nr:TonB-dependent receptor [Pseudopedobacter sp.]
GVGPAFSNTLTGKQGKFGFNSNIGFSDYEKPFTSRSIDRKTFGGNANNFNQIGGNETFSDSKFINLGLTYDVDTLNLLIANLGLYNLGNEEILNLETSLTDLNGSLIQQYLVNSTKEAISKELGFGFDYQRNFAGRKDKILNISYLFTNAKDVEENLTKFNGRFNYNANDFKQSNLYRQTEHIGQIDFTQSVKKVKIDFGIKTIIRLGESDFNSVDNIGGTSFPTLVNQFDNNQYISSFYNSYQYKLKKWGFIAAYRFELTKFKTLDSGNNISNSYQNFLPNLALNYNINGNESINFIYLKAIRRPNISYLNPFENKLNPNLEVVGNPNLLPITQNNFNIQYRRFKKSSLVLGLKYSFSNNLIQQILTNTSNDGVFRLTYSNIGKKNDISSNLSFNQSLNKAINLNLSGNLIYSNLTGTVNGLNQNNSGFTGDFNLGLNFAFKDLTQLSSRVNYSAPSIFLQGQRNNFPYVIFGVSRSFFKKKLSLSGSLINPFTKLRNIESNYLDDNFVQNSLSEFFFRQYQIRMNYRFGQLKKTSRTNRKSIQNNDAIGVK